MNFDLRLTISIILLSIVFAIMYEMLNCMGKIFAKLTVIACFGTLAFCIYLGAEIAQDSLFVITLTPVIYEILNFTIFEKLRKKAKEIENRKKEQYSSSGLKVANTGGINTSETIMKKIKNKEE